jgi:hypothetical protein
LDQDDPKACQRVTGRAWAEEKIHRAISVRPDIPPVPRGHDPKRHETREGRAMPCRAGTAQVPPLSLTMSCFGRSLKESSCSGSNWTASSRGGLRMEPTRPLRLTGLSSLAGLHSLARSISERLQYPKHCCTTGL